MAEIMANQSEDDSSDSSSTFDSVDAELIDIENKKEDRQLQQQLEAEQQDESSDDKSSTTNNSQVQQTQNQTQNAKVRAKKMEKQQKQMEQQHKSDREMLIKKIQGSKTKGVRLSDDDYTTMLANNIVWNRNLRQQQSSQLAQDAIQEQELFEKQQAIFTDYKPYTCSIKAQTFVDAYKAVLQQQMGYATVNILIQCFQQNKTLTDFKTMTQQDLPEGLTYDGLKDSYIRTVAAQNKYEELLQKYRETKSEKIKAQINNFINLKQYEKIDHKDGKITKIEKSIDIFPQSQLERVQRGDISKDDLLTEKMLSYAKTEEEKLQIIQSQEEIQRQRAHMVEKNREDMSYQKEFKNEVAEYSIRVDKTKGLYNHTFTTKQFQDQSKYKIIPNSVACQTDVSLIGQKQKIPQYKIIFDQAKRSQFQVYCVLKNGQISTTQRNVQTQTEILARQIKNGEINIRHYNVQVAEVVAYIDQERLPLVRIDIKSVEQKLKNCKNVRIVKPKGKTPQGLTDFIILLRKVRPDIAAQGDQIYKQSEDEVKKISTIPNGCWPTLDGVLAQKQPGIYQMAETPYYDFTILTNDILEVNISNGHDLPAFVDKFYQVIDDTQPQKEQKQKTQKFKYVEPLTELGYNTQKEYQQIQKIINDEINTIQQNLDSLKQQKQLLIEQQNFAEAGDIDDKIRGQEYELDCITNQWKYDKDIVVYDKKEKRFLYRKIGEKRVVEVNQVDTFLNPWIAY